MRWQDLPRVHVIEAAAAQFPWPQSQFHSSMQQKDICSVLEVGGAIVGFTVFYRVADEVTLLNIAVHPDYQGRGYGRSMLESGLEALNNEAVSKCFLEVRVSNMRAQVLYQSLGFSQVGERKNYYPATGGREDALVLCRQLPVNELGVV